MSARALQRELAKRPTGSAPMLTVRQHLEKQLFKEPSKAVTENFQELQEMIAKTFENDPVADELAQRIEGLATARVADLTVTSHQIPVEGKLNSWFMKKAFRLTLKGCSRSAVARQLGVDASTHSNWLKLGHKTLQKYIKDPDIEVTEHQLNCMIYYEGITTAEGINANELTGMIYDAAKDDWRAAAHLLARRHPEEWGSGREKMQVEVSGQVEVKHSGILAVAPVATNFEEWKTRVLETVDVEIEALPDLTEEMKRQEEDV